MDSEAVECAIEELSETMYAGPALRIGKLGNCLGPQSQRGPRVLTGKQNFIHVVLSYVDPLCNYAVFV